MRAAFSLAAAAALAAAAPPSQINIHYTQVDGTLSVDFVSAAADGTVEYGASASPAQLKNASTTSFSFDQVGFLHQGLMPFAATPGASGFYRVCSAGECSTVFHVIPNVASGQEDFAIFGDFGLINDEAMSDLIAEASKGNYDSVLHVGDWAYDLDGLASTIGNAFMELGQGYMSTKPTAVVEGNHESCGFCEQNVAEIPYSAGNFTHYKARFHSVSLNSNTGNNRYYSFSRGLTHFVVFTAESYEYSVSSVFNANQLNFVRADLASVDRKATPWVVALVHKDWTMQPDAFAQLAPVLESGGVDILFCGHVHYYNRYLPYNSVTSTVDNNAANADGSVYTNPKYMVTIVTGAVGDIEGDDGCGKDERPSFTCSESYGWGIFTPVNATVARWAFHTVANDGPGPANYSDALTIVSNHRVSEL